MLEFLSSSVAAIALSIGATIATKNVYESFKKRLNVKVKVANFDIEIQLGKVAESLDAIKNELKKVSPSVFLSFANENRDIALRIIEDLSGYNIEVITDDIVKIGDSIENKIKNGIERSQFFIALITPKFIQSQWTHEELKLALHKEKRNNSYIILPLLYETKKLPKHITDRKYVDLKKDYYGSMIQVLERVKNEKKAGMIFPTKQLFFTENEQFVMEEESKIGLAYLYSYASDYSPDHIVGINRGGVLLSAIIALKLQLSTEQFSRCMIVCNKNKLKCDNENISGKVLIIDDTSRTGGTLKMASDFLKNNPKVKSVRTAVIVTCLDENKAPLYKELNFSAFASLNCDIRLPWTKKMPKEEREKNREIFVEDLKDRPLEIMAQEITGSKDPNHTFSINADGKKRRSVGV